MTWPLGPVKPFVCGDPPSMRTCCKSGPPTMPGGKIPVRDGFDVAHALTDHFEQTDAKAVFIHQMP
jgi:hypothetical protein